MATNDKACGFHGNDVDVFYVTPTGRIWLVASEDNSVVTEVNELPDDVTSLDGLITPEEAIEHCRRIEAESGETLLES